MTLNAAGLNAVMNDGADAPLFLAIGDGPLSTDENSDDRVEVIWGGPAGGVLTATGVPYQFTGPADGVASHMLLFSALTAGTFYGSEELTADQVYNADGEFEVTTVTLTLTSPEEIPEGLRAVPGTIGFTGDRDDLIELFPGDPFTGTDLDGNASWDGNTLRITADAFTFDGFWLHCGMYTTTTGTLTVQNSVIDRSGHADSIYGVYNPNGPVTVRDTTVLDSNPTGAGAVCIKSDEDTVIIDRCDLSGFEDGWQCTAADSRLTQTWVHNLDDLGVDPHNDCGQDFPAAPGTGTTVEYCYLQCTGLSGGRAIGESSCWTMRGTDSVVHDTYMEGGAFFLRLEDGTDYVVTKLDFGEVIGGEFGEVTVDGTCTVATWTDVFDFNGDPVPDPT
jgi:hypothetical protein